MSTPEPIVDATQADNSLSGQLTKVIARLNRLPAKAGREGESPSVWKAFGECVRELEEIAKETADTEAMFAAVFHPDPKDAA